MTDDKDIDKLFSTAVTEFDDNRQFMSALTEKLDKVEYIQQIQGQKRKAYKISLIVAFAIGVVFGGIGLALILHMPETTPVINTLGIGVLMELPNGMKGLSATVLSFVITGGILCIALNIQDIYRMKSML